MGTKYAKDVYVAQTTTKTLGVAGNMVVAKTENGDSPYQIYQQKWSNFKFTIIDKSSGQTQHIAGNLRVREFPSLYERANAARIVAMQKALEPAPASSEGPGNLGLASTVHLMGKFKGKTPLQVLGEADGRSQLIAQREWLFNAAQNNPRFRDNNMRQVAAIDEALSADPAAIANTRPAAPAQILLHDSGLSGTIQKKREDGLCPCYNLRITWNINDNYPIEVQISNFWAPIEVLPSGGQNVIRSKAVENVTLSYRLSEQQLSHMLWNMKGLMDDFRILTASARLRDAEAEFQRNRLASQQIS